MAWESISAADVAVLSGVKESDLQDLWYDMASALLAHVCEINNIGSLVTVTDVIDGTGARSIAVHSPPINSVLSLRIDGVTVESTRYTHDRGSVIMIESVSANPYLDYSVFPRGPKNVSITYVSGEESNNVYGLAIALIVKELAALKIGEGADARIQFGSTNRSDGKALSRKYVGVHTRVIEIANTLFRKRLKAR